MHIAKGITLRNRDSGGHWKIVDVVQGVVHLTDESGNATLQRSVDNIAQEFGPLQLPVVMANEDPCRQAYDNEYHKVRADIPYLMWKKIWTTATDARTTKYADEINRLRNVIQAACIGGMPSMSKRWAELFPAAGPLPDNSPKGVPVGRLTLAGEGVDIAVFDGSDVRNRVFDLYAPKQHPKVTALAVMYDHNALDVAARLVNEMADGTASKDETAWMCEASITLQRLAPDAALFTMLAESCLNPDSETAAYLMAAGRPDTVEALRMLLTMYAGTGRHPG